MSTAAPTTSPTFALSLWAGCLVPPIAWGVQLQGVYALSEWACRNGTTWPLHLIAAACLLAAGGMTFLSWRHLNRTKHEPTPDEEGAAPRAKFLAALGLLTGGLFTVVNAAQWLALVWLDPCPSTL